MVRIELMTHGGLRFEVLSITEEQAKNDLIVFADRCWKRKSATRWVETKSAFIPLPPMNRPAAFSELASGPSY
jgi:hypothetical protein